MRHQHHEGNEEGVLIALVDVLLVLLCISAAPVKKGEARLSSNQIRAIQKRMAHAESRNDATPVADADGRRVIFLQEDQVNLDGKPISLDQLDLCLKEIGKSRTLSSRRATPSDSKGVRLFLVVDRDVKYERAIQLKSRIEKFGVTYLELTVAEEAQGDSHESHS